MSDVEPCDDCEKEQQRLVIASALIGAGITAAIMFVVLRRGR